MSTALAALEPHGDPARAAEMAAYNKAARRYLGIGMPVVNALTAEWRRSWPLSTRLAEARALWSSDIHEARVAAAKLLTQARIRPSDEETWALISSWVADFDGWAIADHVAVAGGKRLVADPSRLDQVEAWTKSPHMWTRRAALVFTLPFAKSRHPKAVEIAARARILSWAEGYVPDHDWFIQKSIAWWVRTLGDRDPDAAHAFLARNGSAMRAFARKDAGRKLNPV